MTELSDILLSVDYDTKPFFAVLDGAQFDDLPAELRAERFQTRSLYLDRGDNAPERLVTAPQMVWLGETGEDRRAPADVVPALLDLIGERTAAVFWQCEATGDAGGETLYRHLRGLNMVRLPQPGTTARDSGPDTHETVTFRHADGAALRKVAAALEPRNRARLCGPAERLVFPALMAGEPLLARLHREADWPAPYRGLLTINHAEQIRMQSMELEESRRRVALYLKDQCQPELEGQSDGQVLEQVIAAETTGRELGLKSEGAHAQWAYLHVTTEGTMASGGPVREAIKGSHNPDFALRDLVRQMLLAAKAEGAS